MKVYQVEYRAVVTVVEQDMGRAALEGAALIKDNPHLLSVRAVHERNPASEHPGPKYSQRDSVVANTRILEKQKSLQMSQVFFGVCT
jgi:hypothetical protein